jgi:hypothetical protein
MLKPSDVLAMVLVVVAVIWLDMPRLLLPGLVVVLSVLSMYRWRREGQKPGSADRYRWQLLAFSVLVAAISVPLVFRLVPPNGIYGFRTALTRSSPDVWYPANAFMGWSLLASACLAFVGLLWLPAKTGRALLLATFLVPMLGAVLASFIYLARLA